MILFVNGNEHVAGAWITNNCIYAEEDPKYNYRGKSPHPRNLQLSWGFKLASSLVMKPDTVAPKLTNTDIINSTNEWINRVADRLSPDDVFIVIGWIDDNDDNSIFDIRNYHLYLRELQINHIFFDINRKKDFDFNFKESYVDETYVDYLTYNGFKPVIMSDKYFSKEGHSAWANYLLKHIVKNNMI